MSEEVGPGVEPSRGDLAGCWLGTTFLALHGKIDVFSPGQHASIDADAYQLFYDRSVAMSWLAGPECGEWAMNDAWSTSRSNTHSERVAWFHGAFTRAPAPGQLLPVQAFFQCAGDAMDRLGELDLDAVHAILPARPLSNEGSDSLATLSAAAKWIQMGDADRTRIRVTCDGGDGFDWKIFAPAVVAWSRKWLGDTFFCESFSSSDDDAVVVEPALRLWTSSRRQQVTFLGSLASWSPVAVGWLATMMIEAVYSQGVSGQQLFSVARSVD